VRGKPGRILLLVGLAALCFAVWKLWTPGFSQIEHSGLIPTVPRTQSRPLFRVRVDGRFGYIDRSGEMVIQPQFAQAGPFSEGLAPAGSGDRWGYIDEQGGWVIEPRFRMAAAFSEGLAHVRAEFGEPYGYIDPAGRWIFLPQFQAADPFKGGRAIVGAITGIGALKGRIDAADASDWRWREIDKQGRVLGRVRRDYSHPFGEDGLRPVFGGRIGFENRASKMVIPQRYEETTGFSEGLAAVREPGGKWGYIDTAGNWVVQPEYGWANPFADGLGEVIIDARAGYVDRIGKVVWAPSK
jgi:hypothetical protein